MLSFTASGTPASGIASPERDAPVDLVRRRESGRRGDVEEGPVEDPAPLDARERGLRHLARRDAAGRDGRRQLVRRPVEQEVEVRRHPFLDTTRGTTKCPCAISGRVRGDEGALAGLARGQVLAERRRRGRRQGREELVRHAPQGLEVVDDPGQLLGEPGVLPLGEIERGEPRHAADELAVDLHAREYSQRLDAPLGAPLPSFPP